jgi:glucose-1-phosphate adenylyltransferase
MDYKAMLEFHSDTRADVTVASMEVPVEDARSFGVLGVDVEGRVSSFEEKPEQPMVNRDNPQCALVSMGIYVFNRERLLEVLREDAVREDSSHDFGKDVIPRLIYSHRVYAYAFGGDKGRVARDRYWRDVGTIDAYYDANMDLLRPVPPISLYQEDWPIWTYQGQLPPARTVPGESGNEGIFINSIVANGVVIAGGSVQHSILFSSVYVGDEAMVEDSLLFDGVQVGNGVRLRRCIVDKYVHIPPNTHIGYDAAQDAARFTISGNGIVVVPKGYSFE